MKSGILAFSGERLDPVSGTYHLGNGYRSYSPVLMRFTRPDSWSPFGAGGINAYAYCEGDPVNRADPSGHMSWQAGLGIGLGILGILGAVFTGGASIAAAGSISAALAGASTVSLVVGTAALVADVTGIASAATEESNPKASAALGWTSLAFGILSLGAGLAGRMVKPGTKTVAAASRNIDGYASEQIAAWDRVATRGLGRGKLLGGMSKTNSALEKFAQGHPDDFRLVLNKLSGRDIDQLRATSTTMHNAV
ncbi:RHS repeat-associated core domain-containing protein, partial [Cedecea sp.]|uniref:RHS repeat-associated core domain-containing protein n=1 Tax=Cedecea sp. TaxID=1970739 RepID=UPI0039C8AE08